jgi:hypothetical protein
VGTLCRCTDVDSKHQWQRHPPLAYAPRNSSPATRLRTAMAVTAPMSSCARLSSHRNAWRASKMKFCIGDEVREGLHAGTVTDVGTVLIQVETTTGFSRMVCPWELVRVGPSHDGLSPASARL